MMGRGEVSEGVEVQQACATVLLLAWWTGELH